MLNGFAESIIPYAIHVHDKIKKGETFNPKLLNNLKLHPLLKNSVMFKDNENEIWFSTTNKDTIHFITDAYFRCYREILTNLNKSLNKEEIASKADLPRTTAYRKINELIKLGLIIKNKQKRSLSNKRNITFCKLFHKLEYIESTKTNTSNMKFCINKNIFKKILGE